VFDRKVNAFLCLEGVSKIRKVQVEDAVFTALVRSACAQLTSQKTATFLSV